jgi:hypothetical protein
VTQPAYAQNQDAPCSQANCVGCWNPDTSVDSTTWNTFPPSVQVYALDFATTVLWGATGRRFGLCTETVRPCQRGQIPAYLTFPAIFDPYGGAGGAYAWGLLGLSGGTSSMLVNFACCPGGTCQCSDSGINLPGPVGSVSNVTINGSTLDPNAYRLDGHRLVRQDGYAWPQTQDFSKAAGQTNTWSVTYTRGEPVPDALNRAAGLYAIEVGKARNKGTCALPQRVTSIARQGVSVTTVPVELYLQKNLTGVADVDQIILTYNPFGLRSRPRVSSPDLTEFR